MLHWPGRTRRWRLHTRLLAPILILIVGGAGAFLTFEERSVRRQQETLVAQRGQAVLAGIMRRTEDRQRATQGLARLLADRPGLAELVERADTAGLARVLAPLRSRLDLGRIEVYARDGSSLLLLGPDMESLDAGLVRAALAGRSDSLVAVAGHGLAVMAGTPVTGVRGIAGVLVVGTVLGGPALEELVGGDTVEIAVYAPGRLVGTTVTRQDLVRFLAASAGTRRAAAEFDRALARFGFRASALPVEGGLLVALVPVGDLTASARERELVAIGGTAGLLLLLAAFVLLVSREVVRPLHAIVDAAGDIIRGNYRRRLPPSPITELDDLTRAINLLTERLQGQIERLEHEALHDPLSRLPNRTLFMDRLESALARAERRGGRVAVMFLDLDNFKEINDRMGHAIGDRLLVAAAQRLSQGLRAEDTIARLGGDEFVILLEEVASEEEAAAVAERIAGHLRAPLEVDGQQFLVTTSLGIAISEPGATPDVMLRCADIAMYQAKHSGKARFAVGSLAALAAGDLARAARR